MEVVEQTPTLLRVQIRNQNWKWYLVSLCIFLFGVYPAFFTESEGTFEYVAKIILAFVLTGTAFITMSEYFNETCTMDAKKKSVRLEQSSVIPHKSFVHLFSSIADVEVKEVDAEKRKYKLFQLVLHYYNGLDIPVTNTLFYPKHKESLEAVAKTMKTFLDSVDDD